MLGDLHRLVDGRPIGHLGQIENLKHGHPHDGRGHPGNPAELPAHRIALNVPVQLVAMAAHALDHGTDVGKLILIGIFSVERILFRHDGKVVSVELFFQELLHGAVAVSQLICQLDGNLPGCCSGHVVSSIPVICRPICILCKISNPVYYTRNPPL